MEIWRADHDLIAAELPALAREKADQAREIIGHPGTAWWFNDIDLDAQAWLSIEGTLTNFIYGTPPNTLGWERPANPSQRWERKAQKPFGNQTTSTLYGPHLTSELVGRHDRVGDYMCEFPLAWWTMRFLEEVKVFEIHGPADWHDLCVRYPAKGTEDDRLVPNWGAVAEEMGRCSPEHWRSADRRAEPIRIIRRMDYAEFLACRADLLAARAKDGNRASA